jgi:alpha-tubulin suppressor-like RCC1 family protein
MPFHEKRLIANERVHPMRSTARYAAALAAACISVIGCQQDAESPTGPEPGPSLDASATTALAFTGMNAGDEFSCGISTDSRAYCWGWNNFGQLGDGTTTDRLTPVAVAGGLRFRQLSTGSEATCGVTTDYRAYCWGINERGELGDGTTTDHSTPVAVVGGHKFSHIETQFVHTCAVSYPDGRAWCWGLNNEGQLGNGTRDFFSHSTPIAVSGGLTFTRISTGASHTCGLTTSNKIYCWGLNNEGQLGDGTDTYRRLTPRLVTGGLAFAWVDAGGSSTCGVTTDHRAFCWGYGKEGQRGDGAVTERVSTPRAVLGGHLFTKVSAGGACGVTTSNQAWCWGANFAGMVGDGTTIRRLTPHLVAGGHAFNQVSTGSHTCARTTAAVGYCWGQNFRGELGNGTTTGSTTPVAVSGAN